MFRPSRKKISRLYTNTQQLQRRARQNRVLFSSRADHQSDNGVQPEVEEEDSINGSEKNTVLIDGLLPENQFASFRSFHQTLMNLRYQLPRTLFRPLSMNDISTTYTSNATLVTTSKQSSLRSNETKYVLAKGRDFVLSLSVGLVTLARTMRRAQEFWISNAAQFWWLSSTNSEGLIERNGNDAAAAAAASMSRVDVDLVMPWNNNNLASEVLMDAVLVRWNVTVPSILRQKPQQKQQQRQVSSNNNNAVMTIAGLSELSLDTTTALVKEHCILNVTIDGQRILLGEVGEFLAPLLQNAVQRVTDTNPSFLGRAMPILKELGDGLLQVSSAGDAKMDDNDDIGLARLYATASLQDAFESSSLVEIDDNNMPTENYDPDATPLPGSRGWSKYESAHNDLTYLYQTAIPLLASSSSSASTNDLQSLFASNATLISSDGTTPLLSGANRISDLYRSLSSIFRSSGGQWSILSAKADWTKRKLTLRWMWSNSLFLTASSLDKSSTTITGMDEFILNTKDASIDTIRQIGLAVGGRPVVMGEWLQTMISTIESGRLSSSPNTGGGGGGGGGVNALLQEMLRRVDSAITATPRSSSENVPNGNSAPHTAPPLLDKVAAANVYNLMRCLHMDLPSFFLSSNSDDNNAVIVPGEPYLDETIELRGLLGERLATGIQSYRRTMEASVASLRIALSTQRIRFQKPPQPCIELTSNGSIRVTLILHLIVMNVTPTNAFFNVGSSEEKNNGLPLTLDLISEYRITKEAEEGDGRRNMSGKVVEHRIVENRINGRRSPIDVVTNMMTGGIMNDGTMSSSSSSSSSSSDAMAKAFLDTIIWAQKSIG